jgi:hypothetical protein
MTLQTCDAIEDAQMNNMKYGRVNGADREFHIILSPPDMTSRAIDTILFLMRNRRAFAVAGRFTAYAG